MICCAGVLRAEHRCGTFVMHMRGMCCARAVLAASLVWNCQNLPGSGWPRLCPHVCADVDVVLMQNPFEMSMSRDVEGDVIAQLDPGNV
jgi:hypothetical protein